jgi:hypothetical protein
MLYYLKKFIIFYINIFKNLNDKAVYIKSNFFKKNKIKFQKIFNYN